MEILEEDGASILSSVFYLVDDRLGSSISKIEEVYKHVLLSQLPQPAACRNGVSVAYARWQHHIRRTARTSQRRLALTV